MVKRSEIMPKGDMPRVSRFPKRSCKPDILCEHIEWSSEAYKLEMMLTDLYKGLV